MDTGGIVLPFPSGQSRRHKIDARPAPQPLKGAQGKSDHEKGKDTPMKIRTTLATLAILLAPGLAVAGGCHKDEQVTMSCAEGMVWDEAKATCVNRPSS